MMLFLTAFSIYARNTGAREAFVVKVLQIFGEKSRESGGLVTQVQP